MPGEGTADLAAQSTRALIRSLAIARRRMRAEGARDALAARSALAARMEAELERRRRARLARAAAPRLDAAAPRR
ncbi:MAG: hypothetical protein AAFR16_01685 [Pseudomonadota bacterium]